MTSIKLKREFTLAKVVLDGVRAYGVPGIALLLVAVPLGMYQVYADWRPIWFDSWIAGFSSRFSVWLNVFVWLLMLTSVGCVVQAWMRSARPAKFSMRAAFWVTTGASIYLVLVSVGIDESTWIQDLFDVSITFAILCTLVFLVQAAVALWHMVRRQPLQPFVRSVPRWSFAAAVLLILIRPALLPGCFCFVTIKQITMSKPGVFAITYAVRQSTGSRFEFRSGNRVGSVDVGESVLKWYQHSALTLRVKLPAGASQESLFRVRAGETYLITKNRQVVVYEVASEDSAAVGRLSIRPSDLPGGRATHQTRPALR